MSQLPQQDFIILPILGFVDFKREIVTAESRKAFLTLMYIISLAVLFAHTKKFLLFELVPSRVALRLACGATKM
jgi:hypothetical protein